MTAKELKKTPFKMDNKIKQQVLFFQKIIDKNSKDIKDVCKIGDAITNVLLKNEDPIKLWIQSNALDELGLSDHSNEFKLKAAHLGYSITFEKINIENTTSSCICDCGCDENCDGVCCATNEKLRSVKVEYNDGNIITTSMSADLTDKEILDYFKIGKYFNIGSGEQDNMQPVKHVDILENYQDDALVEYKTIMFILDNCINKGQQITDKEIITICNYLDKPDLCTELKITKSIETLNKIYNYLNGVVVEGQTFMYSMKELLPFSIYNREKIEKEFDYTAVFNTVVNDYMLKYAYSTLQTDNYEEDMKMMYNKYIKNDIDLTNVMKTYESKQGFILENTSLNTYVNIVKTILTAYNQEPTDVKEIKLLDFVIEKVTKNLIQSIEIEKSNLRLYTSDVQNELTIAFEDLSYIAIIEKIRSTGLTIENITNSDILTTIDDVFGIPKTTSNYISYIIEEFDQDELKYLDNELATTVLLSCIAILLKEITKKNAV